MGRGATPAASPLPRDVWLPSTQVLLARPAAGTAAGLTLAVKGGHNGEHHNHNDVGSVVVAVDGVPVIVDAGRPTYTAQTFGPDRYDIWTMQSSWHNVPEIRGHRAGRRRRVRGPRRVGATSGTSDCALALDLAGAYPRADIRHWRREARLDRVDRRGQRHRLVGARIRTPAGGHARCTCWWPATVELGDGHAVVTAVDGAGVVRLALGAGRPPVRPPPCARSTTLCSATCGASG